MYNSVCCECGWGGIPLSRTCVFIFLFNYISVHDGCELRRFVLCCQYTAISCQRCKVECVPVFVCRMRCVGCVFFGVWGCFIVWQFADLLQQRPVAAADSRTSIVCRSGLDVVCDKCEDFGVVATDNICAACYCERSDVAGWGGEGRVVAGVDDDG